MTLVFGVLILRVEGCIGLRGLDGCCLIFVPTARAYKTMRTMRPGSPPMPVRSPFMSNYFLGKNSKFIFDSHHSSSCDEACNPFRNLASLMQVSYKTPIRCQKKDGSFSSQRESR